MRLLTKTNLYNILFSLLAFAIGGLVFYAVISGDIYDEADETLLHKKNEIEAFILKKDTLPDVNNAFDIQIYIAPSRSFQSDRFIDTTFFSKEENEDVEYRLLTFTEKFHDQYFRFTIAKSQIESEDLIGGIIISMLTVFAILLIILIIFNFFLSKKIWKPFYKSLKILEDFNLQSNTVPEPGPSNIAEFRKLNQALKTMMEKMLKDFSIQKEFSENASHEMQTPLAIIKAKLELLMQSENYTEEQAKLIQDISETTSRLSRINQALLLITKIENQQFPVTEEIDIEKVILKHLQNFEEIITEKNIEIKVSLQPSLRIHMNPLLADVMITNIISNAIRHNVANGKFHIQQINDSILFENTGTPLNFDADLMYERFRKDRLNVNSHGLGLSIVKKIIDNSNLRIEYTYEEGYHSFRIRF